MSDPRRSEMTAAEHLEAAITLLHAEHGLPHGACDLIVEIGPNDRLRRVSGEHWSWRQRLIFGRNDLSRPGDIAA